MAQTMTDSVGEMICMDTLTYSFVENKGFCKLVNVLAPHYTLPTGIQFSNNVVLELHQNVKTKLQNNLENTEGSVVHCTADIWTRKFSFVSLTGHWFVHEVSRGGAATLQHVSALLNMKVINTDYTPAETLQNLQDFF